MPDELTWTQHAQLLSDFLIFFKVFLFIVDLFCFMFFSFSISHIFSTSSLLALFFRFFAEATHSWPIVDSWLKAYENLFEARNRLE